MHVAMRISVNVYRATESSISIGLLHHSMRLYIIERSKSTIAFNNGINYTRKYFFKWLT